MRGFFYYSNPKREGVTGACQAVKISNTIRAATWIVMVLLVVLVGPRLDGLIGFSCNALLCRIGGAVLLAVILRAASVTGRYLAVYGKTAPGKGFGEIDRLVDKGPYSCMRHPMHFFLAFFPTSVGLLVASPGSVLLGLAEAAIIMYLAVTLDERESVERFGEAYLEYRRRVPAFNPSPRCLYKALAKRPPKEEKG